jgi:hypothetical protein
VTAQALSGGRRRRCCLMGRGRTLRRRGGQWAAGAP